VLLEHRIMVQYMIWVTPTRGTCQISHVYHVFFCVTEKQTKCNSVKHDKVSTQELSTY